MTRRKRNREPQIQDILVAKLSSARRFAGRRPARREAREY
jgi:hypothetical protein